MCPKSSLLLLLVLVFCREWGSYFILQVKAATLIPLLPNITSIRLPAVTCCDPEGWQCIWYWLAPSSFAYSISSMKSQLWALIWKQGMWCMVSVGRVCFWHEQLLFLGSSWLLTAQWGAVPSERALCPLEPQPQLHKPRHHLLANGPTRTHLTVGWKGPRVTGVVQPVLNCLLCTGSLSQDLTCDLSSGRHNLSFLQGSSTKLSSLTCSFGVRQT